MNYLYIAIAIVAGAIFALQPAINGSVPVILIVLYLLLLFPSPASSGCDSTETWSTRCRLFRPTEKLFVTFGSSDRSTSTDNTLVPIN